MRVTWALAIASLAFLVYTRVNPAQPPSDDPADNPLLAQIVSYARIDLSTPVQAIADIQKLTPLFIRFVPAHKSSIESREPDLRAHLLANTITFHHRTIGQILETVLGHFSDPTPLRYELADNQLSIYYGYLHDRSSECSMRAYDTRSTAAAVQPNLDWLIKNALRAHADSRPPFSDFHRFGSWLFVFGSDVEHRYTLQCLSAYQPNLLPAFRADQDAALHRRLQTRLASVSFDRIKALDFVRWFEAATHVNVEVDWDDLGQFQVFSFDVVDIHLANVTAEQALIHFLSKMQFRNAAPATYQFENGAVKVAVTRFQNPFRTVKAYSVADIIDRYKANPSTQLYPALNSSQPSPKPSSTERQHAAERFLSDFKAMTELPVESIASSEKPRWAVFCADSLIVSDSPQAHEPHERALADMRTRLR